MVKTTVQILNKDLELVAEVRALYPLNEAGMVLQYSKRLSDFGDCRFRIATDDPILTDLGDIIEPHKYHVRIKRGETVVWRGAIVDNPVRNRLYQEILAHEYLYYFDKVLVNRTDELFTGDGFHYRIFDSGTMATAVTTIITEMLADLGSEHVLAGLTTGTVENPNFPPGMVTSAGAALTGTWTFSDDLTLQFDYHTALFVLQAFGIYGDMDFDVDEDLEFTFKSFIGNNLMNSVAFSYGTNGNLVDYDIPRYGRRMANRIQGIAAQVDGTVLRVEKSDNPSIDEYGLLESPAAYNDVKDTNTLRTRTEKELRIVKLPENSPINLVLDENGYPLGVYDVGDIVSVNIQDRSISYSGPRRVIGIDVNLHNTGRELTTVTTNIPKDEDLGI